jgi:hypothetical protein
MRSESAVHTVKAGEIERASVAKNSRATPESTVLFFSKHPKWALSEAFMITSFSHCKKTGTGHIGLFDQQGL